MGELNHFAGGLVLPAQLVLELALLDHVVRVLVLLGQLVGKLVPLLDPLEWRPSAPLVVLDLLPL